MKNVVIKEKWLESEKAGYDIGMSATELIMINSGLYYLVSDMLRKQYCGTICRYSWSCEVWEQMKKEMR